MALGKQEQLRGSNDGRGWVLKQGFGAGAAINTNIPIVGIKTVDILVSVFEIQPPTAASLGTYKTDLGAETSITSDGNVQCTTTNTTGNQVLVTWWSKV